MKKKILFLSNIPSPYRVDFFNELGKSCTLTVIFERESSNGRDESWSEYNFAYFKGIILKGINIGIDKAFAFAILKYIRKDKYDHIVVSNPLTPTGMLAIEYMKLRNIKYTIEGDGAFPKENKTILENVKRHFIRGANNYLSTASVHDSYYLKYGAEEEKIKRYPFSSIRRGDILEKPITNKVQYRERLGIKENKMVLSVGRFVHIKGYDVLLKAVSLLGDADVGFYIIGGEITEEYRELKRKLNLKNVHFINFKKKEELAYFYQAADIFVLPTRMDPWGLVINEAMSFGLPVITTNKCIAGLELIEENKNGYIVPVEEEDILANKINTLLYEKDLYLIGKNNISKVSEYTIESMAEYHSDFFEGAIK